MTFEKYWPFLLFFIYLLKDQLFSLILGFKNINSQTFEEEFKRPKSMMLIDVRTEIEYESFAFRGSRNIPIGKVKKCLLKEKVDFNIPIYLVCASGLRSLLVACSLRLGGFKNIYNILGGMRKVRYLIDQKSS